MLLGTAVSIAALYLAFRNVPLADLLTYMASIDLAWIIPTVVLVWGGFALRAARWRYILLSTHSIGFSAAYHPLIVGFMINCILPGRVGEVARPLMLFQRETIPVSTGLATVVVERVLDLIILLGLFMLVLSHLKIGAGQAFEFSGYHLDRDILQHIFNLMLKGSAVLIAFILLISLKTTRSAANRLILRLPNLLFTAGDGFKRKVERKICMPMTRSIENISQGMTLVRNPVRTTVCLGFSLAVWSTAALSYYVFSIGCPAIELNPFQMTAVMVIICFVIALPSVPGFWGLWEAGGVFALALFGVPEKEAAGFTLANHAVQIIPVILAGMISAWISGVNIVKVSYQKT
jgi:hypothetical protein